MVIGLLQVKYLEGEVGKHIEEKYDKGKSWKATTILELVHSDVVGLFPVPFFGKARYVLTFIDEFSWYTWVFWMSWQGKGSGLRHKLWERIKSHLMISPSNYHHRIILEIFHHNYIREELYFFATSIVSYLIDGEKVVAKVKNMK